MRKLILLLCLAFGLLALAGCDEGVQYLLGEEVNFHPEGGPYQYVLSQAVVDAANDFDFAKYRGKKVYFSATGPTQYTQALAYDAIFVRLTQEKAQILERLSDKQKEQGLTEEKGDYELNFTMPVCGVHSYDGLVRTNIMGLAYFRLDEKSADGSVNVQTGRLHRLPYKGWVFSPYFIVALLAVIAIFITLLLFRVMGSPRAKAYHPASKEINAGR